MEAIERESKLNQKLFLWKEECLFAKIWREEEENKLWSCLKFKFIATSSYYN